MLWRVRAGEEMWEVPSRLRRVVWALPGMVSRGEVVFEAALRHETCAAKSR